MLQQPSLCGPFRVLSSCDGIPLGQLDPATPLQIAPDLCQIHCVARICGGGLWRFRDAHPQGFARSGRDLVEGDDERLGYGVDLFALSALAFFASLELYLINAIIAGSPVTLAVPLFQSLLITLQVATGGAFFREFDNFGPKAVGFVLGAIFVVSGIAVLSSEQRKCAREMETSEPLKHSVSGISLDEGICPDCESVEESGRTQDCSNALCSPRRH